MEIEMHFPRHAIRGWLVAGALAAPLLAAATAAQADDEFAGDWRTNMGAMRLDQDGDRVNGTYEMKGGRVRGHVEDNSLTGIWTQDAADHRCFEERMGSRYWGRFRLTLNDDGDSFSGRWSYCDDAFGSGGDWTGERHRHHHHHPREGQDD
jgi:hypothetical protein